MLSLLLAVATASATPTATTAPVCDCQAQCDAMWSEALLSIEHYSGMQLRLAEPALAETYVPRVGLYGRVSRRPLEGGQYAIEGLLTGRPRDTALEAQGLNLFNRRVQRAGDRVTCP